MKRKLKDLLNSQKKKRIDTALDTVPKKDEDYQLDDDLDVYIDIANGKIHWEDSNRWDKKDWEGKK
tara:strand:+ start:547 stop:744 length:198 start_codon:yes stop_codon:yes gene_type:complete